MKGFFAAVLVALALTVGAAPAFGSTVGQSSNPGLYYASEAAAHDPTTGLPSMLFTPGANMTVTIPTATGKDEITISSRGSAGAKSFAATIYPSWTWTYDRYSLGIHIWTWTHYISWAANGQCITNRYANQGYDNYEMPGWTYEGYGAYVINQINPQCNPLGTWWAGRQGHFYNWIYHQDDYPWQLFEAYATGNARTFDWGCNGACA